MAEVRTNKLFARLILILTLGAPVVGFSALYLLGDRFVPSTPDQFANLISIDPATYAELTPIAADQLELHADSYDLNQYVATLPANVRPPRVANERGQLPAFKFGNDVFIVTDRIKGFSAGLAISSNKDFAQQITELNSKFRVAHIKARIYEWTFEIE